MQAQLAILEEKRAESLKPKIPEDTYNTGTIVKISPYVPFVKLRDGQWMSSSNPSAHWDWARLFSNGPGDIEVLYQQ